MVSFDHFRILFVLATVSFGAGSLRHAKVRHPWRQENGVGPLPRWLDEGGQLVGATHGATHPRLRVLDKDLDRIRDYIKTDATAAEYYSTVLRHGTEILVQPPVVRPPPGPSGILTTVRVALERVYTTGLLYRLSQPANRTWLERGWKELEASVNFSDWNPNHFLDVAEMTHTVAIGYDWFYDDLTEDQRAMLEKAIEVKGFQPALQAYKDKSFWTQYPDNWNNVCNGGLIVGYLAVMDRPQACPSAAEVFTKALAGIPKAMASYGPKGAWPEGVGYWAYATRYTVFAITALETVLGTDKGLGETPGFNLTALFVLQATAPSLQFFNYADSGAYHYSTGPTDTPSLFYLATRFNLPSAAFLQRLKVNISGEAQPDDLIEYTPMGTADDVMKLPKCALFPRQNVLMARSAWLDPKATWIGIKAGITHEGDPHGHLDIGSFVYEALGHRWAIDLGADSYALPEYFGKLRFTYYRLRNIGHNTLTFDEENQAENTNASITSTTNCPGSMGSDSIAASIDMTSAYAPSKIEQVLRHFNLTYPTNELMIIDEISYGKSTTKTVTWALHTFANVSIIDKTSTAHLSRGSHVMQVSLATSSPESSDCPQATFSYQAVDLQPPQESTKGINKLMIQAPAPGCTRLVVSIKPA